MKTERKRRSYVSTDVQKCAGCKSPIPAGEHFWRGTTKEPWHPACRRLGINVTGAPPLPRYRQDNPVGRPCEGCDFPIEKDDQVVFKDTLPWHRECFKQR